MSGWLQDLRYAVRQLRKSPGFTLVAVTTLALAIGATTAIFSVVQTVLFAPLPYRDIDRLTMIWGRNPGKGDLQFPLSAGDFTDWKQQNRVFEDIVPSYDDEVTMTGAGEPKLVLGYAVGSSYFSILGVTPRLGRVFSEDEAKSRVRVAVLSDRLWRNTLHSDPQILGKSITLDSKSYVVVGVMPAAVEFPPRTELWLPLELDSPGNYRDRFLRVVGRLKPGVSLSDAQLGMNVLEHQIAARHPDTDAGNETWVEPLRNELSGDIRMPLLVLLSAVGLVLAIACVNIAGLFVARTAGRQVEVSLRVAIGAGRWHILRPFLCESLLLSLLGGAIGVLFAFFSTRFLLAIFPNGVANLSIPRVEAIPITAPVLGLALAITVITGLVFGVVPVVQFAGANSSDALKESRGSASTLRSARARHILVAAQIAMSLVLVVGGGLMMESFRRVYHEDLGFRPDHVLALEIFLPPDRYPEKDLEKRTNFISSVRDRIQSLPGVESVAATNYLPLTGFWGTTDFAIEGRLQETDQKLQADDRLVTVGYFSTMGISLLRGRDFTDEDRSGTEKVAIVNSTLARRYFAGDDPLDKVIELGDPANQERWRIVGVVADVKEFGPEQAAHADIYRSLNQKSFPLLAFVVRTTQDPSASLKSAEIAMWSVDKDQPIFDAMPMETLATQSITLRRTSTIVLASFAGLALIVAAVGLYGLMAYTVAQRTHEIGIRIALGAHRRDVLRMVLRHGMRLVLVGEIVGLAAALFSLRLASGVLYGVNASNPWLLAAAVSVLTLVALFAAYVPARRATKVDPIVAMRYE